MALLDSLGSGLSGLSQFLNLYGVAKGAKQRAALMKGLLNQIQRQPPPLEIPAAYKNLSNQLNTQALQLGTAQKTQISNDFNQSLQHALGQLQMRGLGGSNLLANLTAGSQKKQSEAIAGVDENLLAQRLGMQQNVGLQGLSEVAGERQQALGSRSALYQGLINPLFSKSNSPLAGITGSLDMLGKYLNPSASTTQV